MLCLVYGLHLVQPSNDEHLVGIIHMTIRHSVLLFPSKACP